MIFDAWRRRRERRVLERRAIPDALWHLTLARFPFLGWRSEDDLSELRRLATLFLAGKEFHGAGGLAITDEIAVAVAAQACLPILKLGLDWYDRSAGIVMHPDEVVARRSVADEDGVVHEYDEVLSGEAMGGGPVMLSWRDVEAAGDVDPWAYNVVLHEFAHVIDMRDGEADGLPPLPSAAARERWMDILDDALDQLDARESAGMDGCLDPYAAEAPEELFAVAVEAFFVTPHAFAAEYAALYALFADFFQQDPQSTAPAGF